MLWLQAIGEQLSVMNVPKQEAYLMWLDEIEYNNKLVREHCDYGGEDDMMQEDANNDTDDMNLIERIKHFEEHQKRHGDEYGAEVLYRARKRIKELEIEDCPICGKRKEGHSCLRLS
jgi:hypothetical protein